jgi:hypothetical protein
LGQRLLKRFPRHAQDFWVHANRVNLERVRNTPCGHWNHNSMQVGQAATEARGITLAPAKCGAKFVKLFAAKRCGHIRETEIVSDPDVVVPAFLAV